METKCKPETVAILRKSIYALESKNIRDKDPEKDSDMVKIIIKEIRKKIAEEG